MAQAVLSPLMSQRSPGYDPSSLHLKSVVPKVALEEGVLPGLRFSPISITPSMSRTHPHFYTALIRTKGR